MRIKILDNDMHWIIGYDSFGHEDKILDNDMHWIVGYDSFGHEDKKI